VEPVAEETREGDVYRRLLEKLEQARKALGGQVFDVLGKLQFEGKPLRDLLIEAIRYGDQPEVRARLTTVETALDRGPPAGPARGARAGHDAMDASRVHRIREDMERAEARRLQPHYIESFFLEADGVEEQGGTPRDVSRRMMYVEVKEDGSLTPVRYAAYLDYTPLGEAARAAGLPGEAAAAATADEVADLTARILAHPACGWIDHTVEARAISHAIAHIVPEHLAEVRGARVERVQKIRAAVRDRLVKEMNYWDKRWNELKLQEAAGKPAARLNSAEARRRADELNTRLTQRLAQLQREEKITPQPPVVLGGAVIVTPAFLDMLRTNGEAPRAAATMPMDTQTSALRAREVVMAVERGLGNEPVDREYEKLGYDIESRDGTTGVLRYIEVKGRVSGADDITVTHNEMLFAEQNPDTYIFVIVEFHDETRHSVHYIRRPFGRGPDFGETSRRYGFADLLQRREDPS
jgi:hypothetical protein